MTAALRAARAEPPPSMVERVTLIMDLFASPRAQLTLEDVTRRTGLPRSTAHRILDQLVKLHWLDHGPCGYGLGERSLNFTGRDGGHGALRAAAAPLLHDLAITTGMVVHLAVLDGDAVHYLDKLGGRGAAAVPTRVGGRAPAHCTAVGKAMLAGLAPEAVDATLPGLLRRPTPRSIGDLTSLHQELTRIRHRNGLAYDRGESVVGIGCVAAAVAGPDGPVAAISLVGDERMAFDRAAPLVVGATRKVARELFPGPLRARRLARPASGYDPVSTARLLLVGDGDWL